MAKLKVIIRKIIAVLKYPKAIDGFIQYADDVHDSMKPKARYAALLPELLLLDGEVTDLHNAQIGFTTIPPTVTVDDRDAKIVIVKDRLTSLKVEVQKLADADKPNAETIITEAGMQVKGSTVRGKRKNSAVNGPEEGSALLTAEGAGGHNWRMSEDAGMTWTILPGTSDGHAVINHLKPGLKYLFQSALILTKDRIAPWSDPFSLRVN